jgi:hypothetical protein
MGPISAGGVRGCMATKRRGEFETVTNEKSVDVESGTFSSKIRWIFAAG